MGCRGENHNGEVDIALMKLMYEASQIYIHLFLNIIVLF